MGNASAGGKDSSRGGDGRKAQVSRGKGKVCLWVSWNITATGRFLGGWMKMQETISFFNIIYAYETTLFLLVLGE